MSKRMSQFFWQNAIQHDQQANFISNPLIESHTDWGNVNLSVENPALIHHTVPQIPNEIDKLDPYSAAAFQGYVASYPSDNSGSQERTDSQLVCLADNYNQVRGGGSAFLTNSADSNNHPHSREEENCLPREVEQQVDLSSKVKDCDETRNEKGGNHISDCEDAKNILECTVDISEKSDEPPDRCMLDDEILRSQSVKENEEMISRQGHVNSDSFLASSERFKPAIEVQAANFLNLEDDQNVAKVESKDPASESQAFIQLERETNSKLTNENQTLTENNGDSVEQFTNDQSGFTRNNFPVTKEQFGIAAPSDMAFQSKQEAFHRSTDAVDKSERRGILPSRPFDLGRGSVRDRYRAVRKQYPEIVKRLDRIKVETPIFQSCRTKEIDHEFNDVDNMSNSSRTQKSSTPKESVSTKEAHTRNWNVSMIENRSNSVHNQICASDAFRAERRPFCKADIYGDDFITSQRRSRFHRILEDRGTKSEMGDMKPYRGPAAQAHREYQQSLHVQTAAVLPDKRLSESYRDDRNSVALYGSIYDIHEQARHINRSAPRRPMSSFDARSYSRYEKYRSHGIYDVYDRRSGRSDDESIKSNESGSDLTDVEVAQLYREQQMGNRYASLGPPDLDEFYYFGTIHLSRERVASVVHRYPPPFEYYSLSPIEKAAYIFYCALYHRHYQPVEKFHKVFNREFYIYTCEGDSPEVALWKICKHTQDEFNAKRSMEQLKAYEMSQKQLFSDDRETPDSRVSDRGSRERDEESDHLSEDSNLREPLKFRVPHPLLTFSTGGKAVFVEPHSSISVVEIRDLKSFFSDAVDKEIFDLIDAFKGPLVAGFTPSHTVRLFVQRQIENIQKSDAFKNADPSDEIKDCLLIWQLLEMIVQQSGKVTGPDLARLLLFDCELQTSNVRASGSHAEKYDENDADASQVFTKYLLGGHTNEAVDIAIKFGMYPEAMILARRLYPNDPKKLEKIELQYLSQKCTQDPLITLLNVATGLHPPILTSNHLFESNNWRIHAAIILSNLSSNSGFTTIYELGCILARHGLNYAADFCFLAVCLLSGYNCFEDKADQADNKECSRTHISLIHATPAGVNKHPLLNFALMDLFATEVFEYALRLATNGSSVGLSFSLNYQLARFRYAEFMSEYGGFSLDAFRYCLEIARSFWGNWQLLSQEQLVKLCTLADSLRYISSANDSETAWIPLLQNFIDQGSVVTKGDYTTDKKRDFVPEKDVAQSVETTPPVTDYSTRSALQIEETKPRFRTTSLSSEAAEWHADHQDPIQMSPVASVDINDGGQISPPSFEVRVNEDAYATEVASKRELKAQGRMPTSIPSSEVKIERQPVRNADWYSNDVSYDKPLQEREDKVDKGSITSDATVFIGYNRSSTKRPAVEASVEFTAAPIVTNVPQEMFGSTKNDSAYGDTMSNDYSVSKTQQEPQLSAKISSADNAKVDEVRKSSNKSQNLGFFGKVKATLTKAIPSKNEMILPDDSNPSIVWDDNLKKYVGGGVEEEAVVPPPSLSSSSDVLSGAVNTQSGGLAAARLSGGSRYFNPLIESSLNSLPPSSMSVPTVPTVPMPVSFGFIPAMPDDAVEAESPFVIPSSAELPAQSVNE